MEKSCNFKRVLAFKVIIYIIKQQALYMLLAISFFPFLNFPI